MITTDKIMEIYFVIDEFYKEFEKPNRDIQLIVMLF